MEQPPAPRPAKNPALPIISGRLENQEFPTAPVPAYLPSGVSSVSRLPANSGSSGNSGNLGVSERIGPGRPFRGPATTGSAIGTGRAAIRRLRKPRTASSIGRVIKRFQIFPKSPPVVDRNSGFKARGSSTEESTSVTTRPAERILKEYWIWISSVLRRSGSAPSMTAVSPDMDVMEGADPE